MTLAALALRFPAGSTVRYRDATMRGRVRRTVTRVGTVVSTGQGANGKLKVVVRLKDGELTTMPENLKPIKR